MTNAFSSCHPIVNFSFFISVTVFGMLFLHPVFLAAALFGAFAYNVKLKGRKAVKSFFLFYLPMLIFVALINTLFNHYGVTVLWIFPWGNNLTLESIVYGLVIGVMVVTVMLWFSCYSEIVTVDKFMYVFGKRIPSVALVITMALRFVPMYKKQFKIIAESQKAIGMDYRCGTYMDRVRNACRIVSILITWALENAIETSNSMAARGYGLKGRTSYSRFVFLPRDVAMLCTIAVCDAMVILGAARGVTYALYNPVIEIQPVSVLSVFVYGAYLLLCLLPLILEMKEDITWNRLQSKI